MRCHYPNCTALALWIPVVELPTLRIAADTTHPNRNGGETKELGALILTDQPTYLLGREVCQAHRDSYNFFDWFNQSDWEVMREAAREYGLSIPSPDLLQVQFRPLGWEPGAKFIELDRS